MVTHKIIRLSILFLSALILLLIFSSPSSFISLQAVAQKRNILKNQEKKDVKPTEEDTERALELYKQRCVKCHGVKSNGRGPLSSNLTPKPTNLRSNVWYRSTNPQKIRRVILGGGGAIGKTILMPANPDLRNKPKLMDALVYHIIHLVDRYPKKNKEKKNQTKKKKGK